MPPEEAVMDLLHQIKSLLNDTNFSIVVLTTLFPRIEMYNSSNVIDPNVIRFNEFLLSVKGKRLFQIEIYNRKKGVDKCKI